MISNCSTFVGKTVHFSVAIYRINGSVLLIMIPYWQMMEYAIIVGIVLNLKPMIWNNDYDKSPQVRDRLESTSLSLFFCPFHQVKIPINTLYTIN